jgi:dGTPase
LTIADHRTESEHDCDRILYSDELRRLGGVTQVVAVGEMPLFHTRLTHTLKVQQLSRRIAEHLLREHEGSAILTALGGIDPSAAEAAGLAHDLGHPPFGHVGEAALHKRCAASGLDGFEGNAQTFRVLTKLARRGEQTKFGLDLSERTLRATIKYPWMRTGDHEGDSKWNAYSTESEKFHAARGQLGDAARSVEAAIMDWADDVTYAIHDLEDFIRAGRVPMVALATDPVERATFATRAVARLGKKHRDVDWDAVVDNFGILVRILFAQFRMHRGQADQLATLRSTSRLLINYYVSQVSLVDADDPLQIPPDVRGEVELFKQLTWHYIIHDPSLATLQHGQQAVITSLFDALRTWLYKAEKRDEMYRLPTRLRDLFLLTANEPGREAYANKKARRARAVADYIASLTEEQATNLWQRLAGSGSHSVLDPWLAY